MSSAASGPPLNPQRGQRAPHKRARTGCDRCRAQRRKCDEGKPQCQRCTKAGAQCQYAIQISFLDKNFQTLSGADLVGHSAVVEGQVNKPIEFILEDRVPNEKKAAQPLQLQDASLTNPVTNENDSDPNSLHGVLKTPQNLENQDVASEDLHPELRPIADPAESLHVTNSEAVLSHLPINLGPWPSEKVWPLVGQSSLSDHEVGLLRHWCHHVSPWLDIYDPQRTFGLVLPQLAASSPCVMDGILRLAAASQGLNTTTTTTTTTTNTSTPASDSVKLTERRNAAPLYFLVMSHTGGLQSNWAALRILVSFLSARATRFITKTPSEWQPSYVGGGNPHGLGEYSFEDPIGQRAWSACTALMSRLEISYALINETAPGISADLLRASTRLCKEDTVQRKQSQDTLEASLECLAILFDVMSFVFPSTPPPPISDQETISPELQPLRRECSRSNTTLLCEKWKKLLTDLFSWHLSRPPELRPVLETEGGSAGGSAFPTLLFGSSAGMWANSMYHVAMMMLLQLRGEHEQYGSAFGDDAGDHTSPLWHARRVCGIALSSDPGAGGSSSCWDPCMIAAFWAAARRVRSADQQAELLGCLDGVRASGWRRVDSLADKLRAEWDSYR
ncbi:hypothetical protein BX600DRAFT_496964 [Xylariales sp. PMI_506]|nr:hypothetical protein BX600DRAFT_496964 [Xylariales sp. PMI_506]